MTLCMQACTYVICMSLYSHTISLSLVLLYPLQKTILDGTPPPSNSGQNSDSVCIFDTCAAMRLYITGSISNM